MPRSDPPMNPSGARAINNLLTGRSMIDGPAPTLRREHSRGDFIESMNDFVTSLMRAGYKKVLVLTDIFNYSSAFELSLRRGCFVHSLEIWRRPMLNEVSVTGLGTMHAVHIPTRGSVCLERCDAILCARHGTRPLRLSKPGTERPGEYLMWYDDKSNERWVRFFGNLLVE